MGPKLPVTTSSSFSLEDTMKFSGYEKEVGHLYVDVAVKNDRELWM